MSRYIRINIIYPSICIIIYLIISFIFIYLFLFFRSITIIIINQSIIATDHHQSMFYYNSEKLKQYNYLINNDVQIENACVSIAALEYLQIQPIGLHSFYWPCRMEMFSYKKYQIILDGCHNGDSVKRFLAQVRKLYRKSSDNNNNNNNNNNISSGTSNIDDSKNYNISDCSIDCSVLVLFGAGHDKCIHDMLTEVFKPNAADSVIMVKI